MSTDKTLLKAAAAALVSNPDLPSVAVTPNGMPFKTKTEADRYAKRIDKVDNGGTVITRAECATEIAEIQGEAPAAEGTTLKVEKKDEAPKDALYTAPDGKAFNNNGELKAEVKARNLEVADNKNATLIDALKANDEAVAKAAAEADDKKDDEGAEGDDNKDQEPQA